MAKFILDTDILAENAKLYKNISEREIYILSTLRAAHKKVIVAPWLTPYKAKKSTRINPKGDYTDAYNEFWDAYPARNGKKSGKRPAFKHWCTADMKVKSEQHLLALCLAALEWQKRHEDWVKDNGQFIPMASTYLNAEGWTDERPESIKAARTYTDMNGTTRTE